MFKCPFCGKKFSKKTNFERHCSIECHKCKKCGRDDFSNEQEKERHSCQFFCPECGKAFSSLSNVTRHLKKPHSCRNDQRLSCNFCEKKFASSDRLFSHVSRTHKMNKYSCDQCGEKCRNPRSLYVHKCRFHRSRNEVEVSSGGDGDERHSADEILDRDSVDSSAGPSWLGQNEQGVCRCFLCRKWFPNFDALRDHNFNEHRRKKGRKHKMLDDRPYKCPFCPASFCRQSTLLVHIRKRHSEEKPPDFSDSSEDDSESDIEDEDFLPSANKLFKTIGEPVRRSNTHFNTEETELTYTLTKKAVELSSTGLSYEVIEKVFHEIFSHYIGKHGFVQVFLDSWTLDFPIKMRGEYMSEQYIMSLMHQIERVLGSKDTFLYDAPVTLKITFVPDPNAIEMGHRKLAFSQCENHEEFCRRSNFCWCPVSVDSKDFGCLGGCVVAFFRIKSSTLEKEKGRRWFRQHGGTTEFQKEVDLIYNEVGISRYHIQGRKELEKFQVYLNRKQYQLVVYEKPFPHGATFYGYPTRKFEQKIYLAIWSGHCYLITDIRGYLKRDVCLDCGCFYSKRTQQHICPKKCPDCWRHPCFLRQKYWAVNDTPHYCFVCDRFFRSNSCYNWHLWTTCPILKRCSFCSKIARRVYAFCPLLTDHECEKNRYYKCENCEEKFLKDGERHFCTIVSPKMKALKPPAKYYIICYDFETYTEEDSGELKPYLVCCVTHCEECLKFIEGDWTEECEICGQRERFFWGKQWEEFCHFLLFDPKRRPGVKVYAWAHNAKRFDHIFILQYLIKNGHNPPLRFKGTQVISMVYNNVELKDFFSFFPQKLASASKAFDFDQKVRKGYFPHLFCKPNFIERPPVLPSLPDEKFYGVENMKSEEELKDFRKWYTEHEGNEFDFKQEAISYCLNDVRVLARAIDKYRKMSLKVSDGKVDGPLCSVTSLAGFSAFLYRACYMPPDSIGLIPRIGYDTAQRQSVLGMKVMDYLNESRSRDGLPLIRHKGNYGEQKIGTYHVDGYEPSSKTVYECHGCWIHACPVCYKSDSDAKGFFGSNRPHPLHKISYNSVLQQTRKKEWYLKTHPDVSKLEIIWECQIKKELSLKPLFDEYWRGRAHLKPYWYTFDLRDSLYGGVCEVFCLSRKLTEEEIANGHRILCGDVVSMYPFVQFAMEWPGDLHPRIYDPKELPNGGRNWDRTVLSQFSPCIASCFLIPPTDELYPTVPSRIKGFTMFVCCYQCALQNIQEICTHKDPRDRGLFGCYTSVDLDMALEYGWVIVQVFQLHAWNQNPTRSDTFKTFIADLIKIKVESSGWPADCSTTEEKEAFLNAWEQKHGIHIESENVEKNPAMRTVAKLLLNSNWGKMAEKTHNSHTEYVKDWKKLKNLLFDGRYKVEEFQLTPDGRTALVTYRTYVEDAPDTGFSNITFASFVTSYARRRLFRMIQQVPGRILYCDTDSMTWEHVEGRFRLPEPMGETLGELKSELGPREFISEFQALGPKNYRFVVRSLDDPGGTVGWVQWKAKGIVQTLACKNSLDSRIYRFLIEKRLQEMDTFYDRYENAEPSIRKRAVEQCRKMARAQREIEQRYGLKHPPGIFVSNPILRRRRESCLLGLFSESDGTKIIKMTANKRVYFPSAAAFHMHSIPFGFKLLTSGEDKLSELVWDEKEQRYTLD